MEILHIVFFFCGGVLDNIFFCPAGDEEAELQALVNTEIEDTLKHIQVLEEKVIYSNSPTMSFAVSEQQRTDKFINIFSLALMPTWVHLLMN